MPKQALVLDDNALTLRLFRALLEKEGLKVIPLTSWAEVTTTLFTQTIDLAFVDVNMPGLSGDRLVEALKKTHEGRKIPIILISDLPEDQLADKAASAGADAWIRKPLTREVLRTTLQRFFPEG